jgi:predicted Ser/Thr protein kinase
MEHNAISSNGWSGCVVGGCLYGHQVALKFAPHKSERAKALLNEVGACVKLKTLWGFFVPTLIDFGRTAKNWVIFMAIERIDGVQLGKGKLALETSKC